MREFLVYVLTDPLRGNEPFYVGKGDRKRLSRQLIKSTRPQVLSRVTAIRNSGLQPGVLVPVSTQSEVLALLAEATLIGHYGRQDTGEGPLLNRTNGGEGTVGRVMPSHLRAQLSERMKGTTIGVGRVVTPEARARIAQAQRNREREVGAHLSDERKAKISASKKGKAVRGVGWSHSEETKAKIRAACKAARAAKKDA